MPTVYNLHLVETQLQIGKALYRRIYYIYYIYYIN